MSLRLAGALAATLLTACASLPDAPRGGSPPPFEFRLGCGDRVLISVWGESQLEREAELGPAGELSFPLIGEVAARGLTLDELRVELAQRLKGSVLVDPVVSVALVTMRSHVVQVTGEVMRPGSVPYVQGATALGAIQAAGGCRPETADLDEVRLIRGRLQQPQAYALDLEAILAGEAADVWLLPGDTIYVPPRLATRWERWWRQSLPWADPLPPTR